MRSVSWAGSLVRGFWGAVHLRVPRSADIEVESNLGCTNCGSRNLFLREDRDDSVGYCAEVLWCHDCGRSAE